MILLYDLSEENLELCGLEPGEEIYYCLPLDIDLRGDYQSDSYVVMTDRRLMVLKNKELAVNFSLEECDGIYCEPQIACGILFVKKDGEDVLLGRYTAKHLVRYSYLARGMAILKSGRRDRVVSHEYEKSCPKCGWAMPGTRVCPHCSGNRRGYFKDYVFMVKPYMGQMAVIIVLMFVSAMIGLLSPMVQRYLVDDLLIAEGKTYRDAVPCLLAMLVLSLGVIFVNTGKNYMCARLGSYISEGLRHQVFEKVQKLSLSFITDRKPGELMNRIVRDTNRVKDFCSEVFCNMFTIVISFIFVLTYMLTMNWKLAILAFVFVPVSVGLSIGWRKKIRRRYRMQGVKDDKLHSRLQDVISGMAVVKSYGQETKEAENFDLAAEEYAEIERGNETFFAVFFPILTFLLGLGSYLVTYFGGRATLAGEMTAGELMQFITYSGMLYGYVGWISNMPRHLMNLITSMERISDVMNQELTIYDGSDSVDLDIQGEVEFKHASFGYKSYQPVLDDISLKVKKGEMIGLVGASGAGKSTMINLIMHLYEIDDGELLIDGVDIRNIRLEKFHSQIGVVLQENFLFAGTIYNNIRFAKQDATYEEVIRAAKMANAHDFICQTPDGYNTYVGEHGYNLSGGERQRIAIARAILSNPRLLILDEATASLDTESEYLIQKALERLTEGRTTFAIAHRLSTLKDADRLVVIDDHHIAEVGSHDELMARKGIYYGLVQAQLQMQACRDF